MQAPTYKFDGKIASQGMHDRWFADLIDFTAAPSGGGKRKGLKRDKGWRHLYTSRAGRVQQISVDGSYYIKDATSCSEGF